MLNLFSKVFTCLALVILLSNLGWAQKFPLVKNTKTFENPVFDFDFPDPTVIRAADNYFYAYATQSIVNGKLQHIQVARSADLINWERLSDALPERPVWADKPDPKFWAPHVSAADGKYFMYYSADPNTQTGLCLAVAVAEKPSGPFKDSGKPLKCGASFVNIDPMAFDDPATGKKLLYWGSGFEPIKVQELAANRLEFAPGSQPVNLVTPIKDENPDNYQRLVEGAWIIYRAGFYYLFFSGDNCCGEKAHYGVMVARSKNAVGPFETLATATGKKDSVILAKNNQWLAPGHNSVVTDDAGQNWIFYHAIKTDNRLLNKEIAGDRSDRRVMLASRLNFRNGWAEIETGAPIPKAQPKPIIKKRKN